MSRTTVATLAVATTLLVAGCSTGGPDTPGTTAGASATSATTAAGPIVVTDAWAKAKPDLGDMPMTGVFATLKNTTDKPVIITAAENSVSPHTELHATVTKNGQAAMQKVDGGFTLEPGATRELRPGGDHVMVMKMTAPLTPGQTVKITLTTQDGQKVSFDAVAKTFTGGDEKYHSGGPVPSGSPSMPSGPHSMPGGSHSMPGKSHSMPGDTPSMPMGTPTTAATSS